MNVGSIVFEPAPVFMKPVDHSCWFYDGKSPPVYVHAGEPMQLYCYIKQLDDVRAFMRRLDISKHVFPLRGVSELQSMCLHGQVFVNITNHHEGIPFVICIAAENDGMHFMEITITGEGQS